MVDSHESEDAGESPLENYTPNRPTLDKFKKNSNLIWKQKGKEREMAAKRNRPGTKTVDFFDWPKESVEEADSSFAIQQYIQASIREQEPVDSLLSLPETLDDDIWQYEQLRQITQDLNLLVARLIPVTTPEDFPTMKTTDEESYLLPTPNGPIECSAIDYILHTLANTESLLNNQRYFPSRISVPPESVKHFSTLARRLFRILAFAQYHHKDLFDEFESETRLLERFVKLSKKYDLVPEKALVIPVKN